MTVIPRFTNSTAVPLPNESLPAGLSTGAKAGIGVSATMAAFGILVAILYLSMRKKKNADRGYHQIFLTLDG